MVRCLELARAIYLYLYLCPHRGCWGKWNPPYALCTRRVPLSPSTLSNKNSISQGVFL